MALVPCSLTTFDTAFPHIALRPVFNTGCWACCVETVLLVPGASNKCWHPFLIVLPVEREVFEELVAICPLD
jgi:hypothetical protein